ncbi:MAG TPA: di-heme oxidoredictase family protein [Kofleriaceae bacterium]
MKTFVSVSLLPVSLIFTACTVAHDGSPPAPSGDPSTTAAAEAAIVAAAVTEAPTGFDNLTNGFCTQAQMDGARAVFEENEGPVDGLGPCYNLTSCASCHQNPFSQDGTGGQVNELRAGHFNGTSFVAPPGGSLIHDRAVNAGIQEHVPAGNEVLTFRTTISASGDGFVEAIADSTLQAIANAQPAAQRGTLIQVAVLEAAGATRAGRFGWKSQHASLLSTTAQEYLDEIGITSRLLPTENICNGVVVQGGPFDGKADPEDDASDIDAATLFLRCMKAPPRGPVTANVSNGQTQFNNIGCAVCHVATITTAPAGTVINGGTFTVPAALGDKNIHPFGDYLLHDIGTGDGIVQNGGAGTRNMVRTAALWGIRVRTRLMHDGANVSVSAAIQRHANQAATARNNFNALSAANQADVLAFISSL